MFGQHFPHSDSVSW